MNGRTEKTRYEISKVGHHAATAKTGVARTAVATTVERGANPVIMMMRKALALSQQSTRAMSATEVETVKTTTTAADMMIAVAITPHAMMDTTNGSGENPKKTRKMNTNSKRKSRKNADSTCSKVKTVSFTRLLKDCRKFTRLALGYVKRYHPRPAAAALPAQPPLPAPAAANMAGAIHHQQLMEAPAAEPYPEARGQMNMIQKGRPSNREQKLIT